MSEHWNGMVAPVIWQLQCISLKKIWKTIYVFNSLAPGRFDWNFKLRIFMLILVIGGWGIFREIALRWKSEGLPDDKSILGQVMAWCRQATSHYLSQCWPRSMSPHGVTWPQWVKFQWRLFHLVEIAVSIGFDNCWTPCRCQTIAYIDDGK